MEAQMQNRLCRGAAAALVALVALVALSVVPSPAMADKLVLFKNGKALRAKTAVKDGIWLKCEIEDKNYISVPASFVLSIEESGLGAAGDSLRPNQVAAGSGGGYVPSPRGGGDAAPPPEVNSADPSVPQDDPEYAAGLEEEQAYQRQRAMEMQAQVNRRGGAPMTPVQTGLPGGLQPLNQPGTPFQNRRLNQRGGTLGVRPQVNNPAQANQE
jgi:hypothetical protein